MLLWWRELNPRSWSEPNASPGLILLKNTHQRPWIMAIRFPKPVTAHMLRHTVATTLLFNGCPIGHIKEILGHNRLITTCNFYLGADKRAAKKAHQDFLDYEREE